MSLDVLSKLSCKVTLSDNMRMWAKALYPSKTPYRHVRKMTVRSDCIDVTANLKLYHLCYKTNFAKSHAPQSYLGILCWILSEHSVQVCTRKKKLRCIFYLFTFLENTCFVYNSLGNGPVEGAITSILKHEKAYFSKTRLHFFLIFVENVPLLPLNLIKLIPSGPKYKKSAFPMWLY